MILRRVLCVTLILFVISTLCPAQEAIPQVLSMRQRAQVVNDWLRIRLDRLVPELMRREGVDMWVLIAREYNEDPVVETMLPATYLAARRRTILVFFDRGSDEGVERLSVSRYAIGDFFEAAWNPAEQPDQYAALAQIIARRDPQRIAINYSETYALADGISHSEYQAFTKALPEELKERIESGEPLAVGWLETRTREEMLVYPTICRVAHAILAEGLSDRVVTPGVTTTADLQWWFRERIRDLRLTTWFHTSVSVQRSDEAERSGDFSIRPGEQVILPGDLVHVDIGICYLGLNTDTQQHAYVLLPGETDAPEGLRQGLALGNRLQDILTSNFATGRTGNEILAASLAQARAEGLEPSIYSHPLGTHGHAAGTNIGMWDNQESVPGTGDYPLHPGTAYAIELNVRTQIPEWGGQSVRIMLEEDGFFDGQRVRYIDGRQTSFHLIGVRQ